MLPKELKLALKRYNKKVFIYEWEYFTERIHDELIFSTIEEFQFLYIEINFSIIQNELQEYKDRLKFWNAFFEQLSQKRYNDLCGLLDNERGIALIFTYSNSSNNITAWSRFCEYIQDKTEFNMQKWSGINYAEYPPKEFFSSTSQQ